MVFELLFECALDLVDVRFTVIVLCVALVPC